MKAILFSGFFFLSLTLYSQDGAEIRAIDAHVAQVRSSVLKEVVDSGTISLMNGQMTKKIAATFYYRDTGRLEKVETHITMYPAPAYGINDTMQVGSVIWYRNNQMVKIEEWIVEGQKERKTGVSYFKGVLMHTTFPKGDKMDRVPIQQQQADSYLAAFRKLKLP